MLSKPRIEFGDVIDPDLNARVHTVYSLLDEAREAGKLPGVLELVPSFRALAVYYSPLQVNRATLVPMLESYLTHQENTKTQGQTWCLPSCYDELYAPDIAEISERAGMTIDDVIKLHTSTDFQVYILGFVPGFAYMGSVPEQLRFPRRTSPRTAVPAGSVAIAGDITAVYPLESPGGWHLIGRCPVPMFDPVASPPVFLAPGDRVRFQAVDEQAFRDLSEQVKEGTFDVLKLKVEA